MHFYFQQTLDLSRELSLAAPSFEWLAEKDRDNEDHLLFKWKSFFKFDLVTSSDLHKTLWGTYQLTYGGSKWPLTATKHNRGNLLNMGHPLAKNEVLHTLPFLR
ncbi:hypothetical protein HOLleu_11476 [Holothuria leucospilota]|uniref:Uncharacterized protein n=1 Tax=Holothuria leucospilota TaxID=206669 RepID=A0A9Q1CGK8_HOLLE|nr:hypothetical protein HOLleu_11476 [Holothuria leucospilota]